MPVILIALLGLGGWLLLHKQEVTVETLSSLVKRVNVDGRGYLVTRLGGGTYNVTKIDQPTTFILFGQNGPLGSSGDTKQLESDMQRFPKGLFS